MNYKLPKLTATLPISPVSVIKWTKTSISLPPSAQATQFQHNPILPRVLRSTPKVYICASHTQTWTNGHLNTWSGLYQVRVYCATVTEVCPFVEDLNNYTCWVALHTRTALFAGCPMCSWFVCLHFTQSDAHNKRATSKLNLIAQITDNKCTYEAIKIMSWRNVTPLTSGLHVYYIACRIVLLLLWLAWHIIHKSNAINHSFSAVHDELILRQKFQLNVIIMIKTQDNGPIKTISTTTVCINNIRYSGSEPTIVHKEVTYFKYTPTIYAFLSLWNARCIMNLAPTEDLLLVRKLAIGKT